MKTITPRPPVDKTKPDDTQFMTVLVVAADPATLTYDELVAAAIQADNEATRNLINDMAKVQVIA